MISSIVLRTARGQRGVAMIGVLAAIFLLTLAIDVLAVAAVGEVAMAADQLRGAQALALAEAGAYRALAELRQRLEVDLNATLRAGDPAAVRARIARDCVPGDPAGSRPWRIIAAFAYPPAQGETDWIDDVQNAQAILFIGTDAAPVTLIDPAGGQTLGGFFATITVRPTGGPEGREVFCEDGRMGPERYEMYFDFMIVATGVTRPAGGPGALRTICLIHGSTGAVPCAGWDRPGWVGSGRGFPVVIEGGETYTAARWPRIPEDSLYEPPLWEELVRR